PIWNMPVVVAVDWFWTALPLKWPTPPPTLTQGETAVFEKTLSRAAGVTKRAVYPGDTGLVWVCTSPSTFHTTGTSTETANICASITRRAKFPSKLNPLPKRMRLSEEVLVGTT